MECRDEQERFENGVLPHDIVFHPAILALQALMDEIARKKPPEPS